MQENVREMTRLWTGAQPVVSAFVASMVRDFRDRDDLLQDIAVTLLESFDKYDADRPFVAWAIGIARNHINNYYRKVKRDKHVFDSEAIEAVAAVYANAATETTALSHFLTDCISALDQRAQHICELRYHQEMQPAAIAGDVGMSPNSVAKALQRVRETLRECVSRKITHYER